MILRYTVVTVISLASLLIASIMLIGVLWVSDRAEPAIVEKVWLKPSVVKACDPIEVHVRRYKMKASGVYVERYMVDSTNERASLPTTDLEDNPGAFGDEDYYVTYVVPCTLSPGWATYNAKTSYWSNPLQRYVWPIPGGRWSEKFCITDGVQSSEQVCKKSPPSR